MKKRLFEKAAKAAVADFLRDPGSLNCVCGAQKIANCFGYCNNGWAYVQARFGYCNLALFGRVKEWVLAKYPDQDCYDDCPGGDVSGPIAPLNWSLMQGTSLAGEQFEGTPFWDAIGMQANCELDQEWSGRQWSGSDLWVAGNTEVDDARIRLIVDRIKDERRSAFEAAQ